MKRFIAAALVAVFALQAMAQPSGAFRPGKVSFCPVFDESFSGYPDEISAVVENRLNAVVTANGAGTYSEDFVITAKINEEDRQVTSTVPAQYIIRLNVQLLAIDTQSNSILASVSLPFTGVDKSETRAVLSAVRKLNPSDKRIATFLEKASAEVVAAYEKRTSDVLDKAGMLKKSGDYEEALAVLGQVPESVPRYAEVYKLTEEVYLLKKGKDKAVAAANAERKAAEDEAREEEARREQDRQMQLQMIQAMQKKSEAGNRDGMVKKVKAFFLGSLDNNGGKEKVYNI